MSLSAFEKRWQSAVHSVEYCVRCTAYGVQWSHRNEGKGMGLKTDPWMTAALCPACHAEIDNGRDMTLHERRAEMDRAIVLTHDRLIRAGRLVLK